MIFFCRLARVTLKDWQRDLERLRADTLLLHLRRATIPLLWV